jgi:hypothetical protein
MSAIKEKLQPSPGGENLAELRGRHRPGEARFP